MKQDYKLNREINFKSDGRCHRHDVLDCPDCDQASHLGVVPAGQVLSRDHYPILFDTLMEAGIKAGAFDGTADGIGLPTKGKRT